MNKKGFTDRDWPIPKPQKDAKGYTKGEWIKEGNKIKAFGCGTIAICPSPTNNEGVLEFVANAHLIAASPKLYEALKEVKLVWPGLDPNITFPHLQEVVDKAIALVEVGG